MASARNSEVRFAPNVIGPVGAIGATIALILLGVPWPVALIAGLGGLGIAVGVRSRTGEPNPRKAIDPFTVGEPWRQFVQGAQRARKRLHDTVATADDGPLKDRMTTIINRLDDGLDETWSIARRGDQIDDAVRRLDPAGLRSKLEALEARLADTGLGDRTMAEIAGLVGCSLRTLYAIAPSKDEQIGRAHV